jgi:Ca2+-transporting ATPase
MAFTVLSIAQMFHAFNQRSNTESIFTSGNGHNKFLLWAFVASFIVIFAILFVPVLRNVFSLTTLKYREWAIVIVLSILPVIFVEITKFLKRKFKLTMI